MRLSNSLTQPVLKPSAIVSKNEKYFEWLLKYQAQNIIFYFIKITILRINYFISTRLYV